MKLTYNFVAALAAFARLPPPPLPLVAQGLEMVALPLAAVVFLPLLQEAKKYFQNKI